MDPQMTEAWYYLGIVYESTEQTAKAISAFQKAGSLDHKMVEAWEKLAHLYLKVQNLDEAKISLKKAFKLTNDPKYAYKLALVAMVMKDYQRAVDLFLFCLDKEGFEEVKPVELWESLSLCYYYLEKYEKSIEYGQKVLEKI
jgi:tetratricopeptide (TPR) repeat protein